MSRKRTADAVAVEVENLTSLEKPLSKVTVHGVITTVSPVKCGRSCNYFEGTIADYTDTCRIVGFRVQQLPAEVAK